MDPVLARFRPLTASQRRVGKYFLVVAGVLLLQILVGSIMAHYYSDRASFYGIAVDRFLPFNFLRDVHIQSPIVWIGLSWIGAALFLAPAISGGEPKGQGFLVDVLFWVTLLIVVGALVGNYLGIMGYIGEGWFWFGNQGLSYIQLGRAWQIGFFAGLAIWSILVFRALWPTRTTLYQATRQFWSGRIRLEHLIWASTVNIALLYVFGMIPLTGIEKSFTISDFWRWWVVHLWVEQSFEFFAAAISAYLLMAVGLVSRQLAERSVYLALILIFLGGVLGTGHHLYWAGEPGLWVPMGTMFSFIEVLPLVLLILEAIQQRQLIKDDREFKYGLTYTYIIGAAFWNFVGAGVFGGGTLTGSHLKAVLGGEPRSIPVDGSQSVKAQRSGVWTEVRLMQARESAATRSQPNIGAPNAIRQAKGLQAQHARCSTTRQVAVVDGKGPRRGRPTTRPRADGDRDIGPEINQSVD